MDEPFSAAILDIDFFKKVNDTYGHAAGDEVLRHIAGILEAAIRPYDQVGRWGGEEFMLVFPGVSQSEALVVSKRIRKQIADNPLLVEDLTIPVTVSLGVASRTEDNAKNIEELFNMADKALYYAKEHGRNRVCCLDSCAE